jgi:hypothetical protein
VIFPDLSVPETTAQQPQSTQITYGKETAFDFETGDFILQDGKPKVVEGVEALRIWIEKTIRTARFRFPIYSFDYGCELEDIIGLDLPTPVLESEIRRAIREALIYDERISLVDNFKISRDGSKLNIEFDVGTYDGQTLGVSMSV